MRAANVQRNTNLKFLLKNVLSKAGFTEDQIAEATNVFSPNLTVTDYFNISGHSHLIKAKGFPSYRALTTCITETKGKRGDAKKKASIPITARYILSLAKQNHSLFSDVIRKKFLFLVREFVKPTQDQGGILGTIRNHCLFTCALFLSCEENPRELSLEELAKIPDDHVNCRYLPIAQLEKTAKFCRTSKSAIDLVQNPEGVPVCFNWNICPSSVTRAPKEEGSQEKKDEFSRGDHDDSNRFIGQAASTSSASNNVEEATFVDQVLANFNANKGIPLDGMDGILKHMKDVHSLGNPIASSAIAKHSLLLVCRFCEGDPQQYRHVLCCCLDHTHDHQK